MVSDSSSVSPLAAERFFQHLNREIWIVTSAAGEERGGLVATWVTQSSIDSERPMVCAGIAPNHRTGELIRSSGRLGLHLLREDQADIAYGFAIGSSRDRDKFADLELCGGVSAVPILADCLAWMTAEVVHTMDIGDRWFFLARVTGVEPGGDGEPLRERAFFGAGTPEQLASLKENREHDIHVHRPLIERWLSERGG